MCEKLNTRTKRNVSMYPTVSAYMIFNKSLNEEKRKIPLKVLKNRNETILKRISTPKKTPTWLIEVPTVS